MQSKIGILALIFALCFVSIGLPFADDFQIYNYVNDSAFTSNYTIISDNANFNAQIETAPDDSLTLHAVTSNIVNGFILINQSKFNTSYPFNFSITIRSNSTIDGIISILYNLNDSNLSNSNGYRINYQISSGYTAQVFLRRCSSSLLTYSCGVELNHSGIYNSSLDGFGNGSVAYPMAYPSDIILTLSGDSNKRIHLYINGIERLTYYDSAESYLSGALAFGGYQGAGAYNIYFDDLNQNVQTGINTGGWQVLAFPQNWPNWIGMGTFVTNETYNGVPTNCGTYYLAGTQYYSAMTTAAGCEVWQQSGYPINTMLDPTLVITKDNLFWTTLKANMNLVTIDSYVSSPKANICQLYNADGSAQILPANVGYGGTMAGSGAGASAIPLFLNGTSILDSTPILYRGFKILCSEQVNLTYSIAFSENQTSYNPNYMVNITIPIGCQFNSPTDINCEVRVDETNKSNFTRMSEGKVKLCQAGDTRPECSFVEELSGNPNLDSILGALFSYTMIGLYISIFIAVLVAKFTRNGMFGLVILLICILIMTSVGLLGSWFMYMIMVVAALAVAALLLTKTH
jgi:hypothetical protein